MPKKTSKLKQTTLTGGLASSNPSPAKPAMKRKKPSIDDANNSDSDVGAIKLEPLKKDDDDEEQVAPSPSKRRRRTIVGSDDDDSDIVEVKRSTRIAKKSKEKDQERKGAVQNKKKADRPKGKGKAKKPIVVSDSEPEDLPQPRRRKLVKGTRPPMRSDSEESDQVEPERIIESRFRSRDRKTEFQKNLERLKRKKQGKPMDSEDEEEEEEEEEEEAAPFKGAVPNDERDSLFDGSESDGESSFIIEDDAVVSLPAEFSMDAHQDLAHHFKTIFQFFVHIAVRAPVERHRFMEEQMKNEEYFSVPLKVARRKITGLRDSLVASSVWRPDFKAPLEKYPELELVQLDFALPGCDACHLGARMSTLNARLRGEPYDRFGFEDLDESDESDSGSNPDETNRPEFKLGRFCARRTRVYHDLTHWEYMLFKTINDEVDDLHISEQEKGKGRFVKIAWSGGLKPPKDLQDADGICDWLDQRRVIEMEWEKLKGYMERARGLEIDAKKGEDGDID